MNNKDYIKYALLKSYPKYISGESLAEILDISRAAVSKIIKEFKSEGVAIESVNNKGYKLEANSDMLSLEFIKELLLEDSDLDIHLHKILDSTNSEAKRVIMNSSITKDTLIITNEQSNGRGRKGRSFFSPKNSGIYLSLITDFPTALTNSSSITICVAVAVSRALEKLTGLSPKIKWVNDLFLRGKKICGILTEGISDFETGKIEKIIIGIGINFSTTEFPEELEPIATAIFNSYSLNEREITRNHLIAKIVSELKILKNLDDESFKTIIEEYRSKSNVIGRTVTLFPNETISFQGEVLDIDDNGYLVVKKSETEEILKFSYGEVRILR